MVVGKMLWWMGCSGAPTPTTETTPAPQPTVPADTPDTPDTAGTKPSPSSELERWPYVQSVTATEATIAWGTELGVVDTVLRYGAGSLSEQAGPQSAPLRIGMADDEITLHHVSLTGLEPGTRYDYAVDVGSERRTDNLSFRTAPEGDDTPVKFLVVGDMGTGTNDQEAVRDAMMVYLDDAEFVVALGDNAYSSGDWDELHDHVFGEYQELMSRVPMFPTLGNRDTTTEGGQPYLDNFFLPRTALREDHQERYYSADYGPVRLVVLDSEDTELLVSSAVDDQLHWLDNVLADSSERPWIIATYHHPAFTNHPTRQPDLGTLGLFVPRLEQAGATVTLAGHNHHYERSVPIKELVAAPDGLTHVVSGGGGASLYDLEIGLDPLQAHGAVVHHFLLGEADACKLTLSAIGTDGVVFDSVTFERACS